MKVLIGGAFDLIHIGHILKIKAARMLGNYLIVNITPDSRVKRTKGAGRPILSQKERIFIMNNIKGVNEVICVKEKSKQERDEYEIEYIKEVNPDIFITNQHSQKLERFCNKHNIELLIRKDFQGTGRMHTTEIVNRIKL